MTNEAEWVGQLAEHLADWWPRVAAVLHVLTASVASGHAVLTKDEPRAAVGWVGLIWLSPFLGAFLYYVLGINRIRRKAVAIAEDSGFRAQPNAAMQTLAPLVLLGDAVDGHDVVDGNAVLPLVNGDEAYPAMLRTKDEARVTILLCTYIFDNDEAGREFAAALGRAVARGVSVRVLIDATGVRYSFPTIVRTLRRLGVRTALFMPNFRITQIAFFNLRTHRKIMVVDGRVGFTGGINIRAGNYTARDPKQPVQDLHFRIDGPVVGHLTRAFIEDWAFATKEVLAGPTWLPQLPPAGLVRARAVKDGPDEDFEKLLWTILGAIAAATKRIRIMTPYFLPDTTTMRFLNVAALSGLSVEIVLPEVSNLKMVHWASLSLLPAMIERGCKVYLSKPPFDHSKLMIVDDAWVFIGSANWDARSFRLNFELNVECYSTELAARASALFDAKLATARLLTAPELRRRPFAARLRDGILRLGTPYL